MKNKKLWRFWRCQESNSIWSPFYCGARSVTSSSQDAFLVRPPFTWVQGNISNSVNLMNVQVTNQYVEFPSLKPLQL
ncbi:hypothetical protein GDO86_019020 [Hymenochirus boettgeri]|uniref:Uncharacterized protein n=1 Tax=Hymenochirus boettgeri TaxID=247094 RepID=A0A8T2II60_9PIPI|nr:hypothetical protein GDO86_019020 [Hymenochirus boettgeri]